MRLRSSLATGAIAAALTFALAGCFSTPSAPTEEESAPPAISVEPATGELIEGTGYTVNAPEGWVVPPDASQRADVYLIDEGSNADDFINTMNVLLGPDPGDSPAEIETKGVAYLEDVVGATEVEVRPRVTIAGFETPHISALQSKQGLTYWTEQYLLANAGLVFTITFSFGESVSQSDRETLAESVLATWTWAPESSENSGGYFEDKTANYAITFPGEPTVDVTDSGGTRASYFTAAGPSAPDAVIYLARGTTMSEVETAPETLLSMLSQIISQGAVLTGPEETFELEGMPALKVDFTDPNGDPTSMVIAGAGRSLYQLIVIGGTPEERQEFFDSFELLD